MAADARILLVDDHRDNLFALESTLSTLGHPLILATNGDEALKALLRGGVGLALVDVVMPGVSGLDVVRYMQRVEQTQNIPVILLTGAGRDNHLARTAYGLGVADLVVKPIDPWTLRTKVRHLLRTRERIVALEGRLSTLQREFRDHARPRPAAANDKGGASPTGRPHPQAPRHPVGPEA
ncbi:response regulator [Streptomyces tsukubensis]|uniref:Response regulator n=1 Tax=Streptomyces tsukubensis TaxID=83656 RepID=A0A1V3ZZK4_9ACTN|nr:response regulator [Streptomyces tsukubensis]OON71367.1 response regulator [Streptomyces tsukubensis]QFR92321.1 response regulator [Streptomyces tsukubensis]